MKSEKIQLIKLGVFCREHMLSTSHLLELCPLVYNQSKQIGQPWNFYDLIHDFDHRKTQLLYHLI